MGHRNPFDDVDTREIALMLGAVFAISGVALVTLGTLAGLSMVRRVFRRA